MKIQSRRWKFVPNCYRPVAQIYSSSGPGVSPLRSSKETRWPETCLIETRSTVYCSRLGIKICVLTSKSIVELVRRLYCGWFLSAKVFLRLEFLLVRFVFGSGSSVSVRSDTGEVVWCSLHPSPQEFVQRVQFRMVRRSVKTWLKSKNCLRSVSWGKLRSNKDPT